MTNNASASMTGTARVKRGMTTTPKGGVLMDVVPAQASIAKDTRNPGKIAQLHRLAERG